MGKDPAPGACLLEALDALLDDPIVVIDDADVVVAANERFRAINRFEPGQELGPLEKIGDGRWSSGVLHKLLGELRAGRDAPPDRIHVKLPELGLTAYVVRGLPVPAGDGRARSVLRFVEARRVDAAAHLEKLVANSEDAIIGKDIHGRILSWNRAAERLYGYTPEEAIGRPITMLIPPDREGEWHDFMKLLRAGQTVCRVETVRLKKDGSRVDIALTISPIRDTTGAIVGASAIARDISPLKAEAERRARIEERLHESQRMESLAVLAGGIAHDFNNLLMGVLGNAQLLLQRLPKESSMRSLALDIETAGLRAADLTKQMLAYSGKGRFDVRVVDLSEILRETAALLRSMVPKDAVLRIEPAERPIVARVDVTQIRQVVMNLLRNGVEALGERAGTISAYTGYQDASEDYLASIATAHTLKPGRYAFLEVTDTGCGMDAATKARMFDPFYTTKRSGHGLGLSAVLGIVHGHEGGVRVYSEPDRGTTLKVLVPAHDAGEVPAAPQVHMPTAGKRGVILVVDDEEAVRSVARRVLTDMGFQVILAEDGEDAITMFDARRNDIRLILLDLTLPKRDGVEVFRAVRKHDPDLPILLMSGYNEQEVVQRLAGRKLTGFLQKPFEIHELRAKIADVIA